MADVVIDLNLVDDSIIEGDEDFSIDLSNAASSTGAAVSVDTAASSVTTTVGDVEQATGNADGPSEWSLSGDASVDEGGSANYALALSGSYGVNEQVSIVIDVVDVGTDNLDYSSLAAALATAASGRTDISYDSVTSTLTYTSPSDGSSMVALDFQLPIADDAMMEGTEDYRIELTNPTSATGITAALSSNDSVTTVINDTQGVGGAADGPAQWSITGPATADEGTAPQYTVSLTGTYQAGEAIAVDFGLTDIDTTSSDYSSIVSAINAALVGKPGMSFNSTTGTLTYVAPTNGATMADLVIDLPLTDDALIEGAEDFSLGLTNPTSSTGLTVSIDTAANSATTTINDTQGPAGNADGPGEWSISGPADGDEGTAAQYTIALSGTYGNGEVLSVDIGLADIDTNSSDYANVVTAINTAVAGNPDVTFDPITGTFVYTAPSDGATMAAIVIDLTLIDDVLIEGPEDFSLSLSNPSSSTGAAVAVDASASTVTTTINDTQGPNGVDDGPAEWSLTGDMSVDEADLASYTMELTAT